MRCFARRVPRLSRRTESRGSRGLDRRRVHWEDLSKRFGVTVMPDQVPNTVNEQLATRFFTNVFVHSDGFGGDQGEQETQRQL